VRRVILLATITLLVAQITASGTAMAESIENRLGITGKIGVLVPLRDEFISGTSEARTGFAVGGGLIYGFGKNYAVEVEAIHMPNLDVEIAGDKVFEASFTDLSVGLQYRFLPDSRMVPYLGIGADFVKGDLTGITGNEYDMDWTVGGHLEAGLDYFITRGIAFTVNMKGTYTARGDVKDGDTEVGKYDPTSFMGTLGLRLFLPESAFY